MSSQGPYVPLAYAAANTTVSVTATSSPGTTIVSVNVPASSANAIDVEITDIDFDNSTTSTVTAYLQIFVSGFGLTSTQYLLLGHTAAAGQFPVTQYGYALGNIRWFLPNGASIGGQTVNLAAGGTVGFAVYAQTANVITVGVSVIIVWGVYSSVV